MKSRFLSVSWLFALTLGLASAAVAAAPIEIKLATILPVGTSGHKNL
jgi:hypothetical protein